MIAAATTRTRIEGYCITAYKGTGKLPVVRSDRRVFLDLHDLERWIEEHKGRQ